jgi:hypothetical protein
MRNAAIGTIASVTNALPCHFLHVVQWQLKIERVGALISYFTAPHRHPPANDIGRSSVLMRTQHYSRRWALGTRWLVGFLTRFLAVVRKAFVT